MEVLGSAALGSAWWGARGSLFEQVNLGMIGVPPVRERAREYIDLCLIKNGGPDM